MQDLLDRWCADLTLKPPIDLLNPIDQRAQRSQLTITNSIHFAAFDKSDELLLNDYEELMTLLESDSETANDFREIVSSFLTKDPLDVSKDVDREWSEMPIERRLIFESPVPLNEEQRKILMAIRHKGSQFISIEGPPGTGKSHTITAIVFEAILNGQNVLVLSDKTEALDVVEDKLTEVLNSVRFDKNFENPILRLGRSSNSYGRILSNASIQAIKAHLRASPSEAKLVGHIRDDETGLSKNIEAAAAYGSKISLRDIYDLCQREGHIDKILGNSEDLGTDDVALDALDAAIGISGLLSAENGAVLNVVRAVFRRTSLACLQELLKLQRAFSSIGVPSATDVDAMRFFSAFHQKHIAELQKIIVEYQAARWPVFGYLFSRSRVRALDAHLGKVLFAVNTLNAHQRVRHLEAAYLAYSKFSSALSRVGVPETHHCIIFQQVIDGLAPQVQEADLNLGRIGRIRKALEERPYLKNKLGLDPDHVENWTNLGSGAEAARLREVFTYTTHCRRLREMFRSIPRFDYVGDRAKLESLQAQRLAHRLDSEVIEFSDNNRNLALSIRDIIRKKQRFPRDSFEVLRKAFPCMIASIRDFAEFVPLEKDLFDIVVIDEASQVSIAQAFPAFIRAKKLVVLGDRKQFSNVKTATASTGTNNIYVNAIMSDFGRDSDLDDNTRNRLKLFNIKTSVLEFVERIANAQTMLKKHFRSYPELISFSSEHFYNGQLQAVKIRGEPIEDVIRFTAVEHDGRIDTYKNTNAVEYDAIVTELRRLANGCYS